MQILLCHMEWHVPTCSRPRTLFGLWSFVWIYFLIAPERELNEWNDMYLGSGWSMEIISCHMEWLLSMANQYKFHGATSNDSCQVSKYDRWEFYRTTCVTGAKVVAIDEIKSYHMRNWYPSSCYWWYWIVPHAWLIWR